MGRRRGGRSEGEEPVLFCTGDLRSSRCEQLDQAALVTGVGGAGGSKLSSGMTFGAGYVL